MDHSYIRKNNEVVSLDERNITRNPRMIDALYNGGIEEHEDIADYYASELPLKGVRVG